MACYPQIAPGHSEKTSSSSRMTCLASNLPSWGSSSKNAMFVTASFALNSYDRVGPAILVSIQSAVSPLLSLAEHPKADYLMTGLLMTREGPSALTQYLVVARRL